MNTDSPIRSMAFDSASPFDRHLRKARNIFGRIRRRLLGTNEKVATLEPTNGSPRGRVLFSYILDPMLDLDRPVRLSHTHFWESRQMAVTFRDLGYAVDCLHWTNRRFVPRQSYDVYVDVRRNFERIAPQLPPACRKVLHADTAHHAVNNAAQLRRLAELEKRRGFRLAPFKLVEETRAAELADHITLLGNDFTIESFRFAGKPITRIPISTPMLYPAPEDKDFAAAARRFMWFGSEGFVHKGLDLVLDAFAGMPEQELVVCGPIESEPEFATAYDRELFRTPNIRTPGWVDVDGKVFRDVLNNTIGLVYPSCSEGGGGCVVGCMHAGIIPVVTREASVDVPPDTGVVLADASVETIRAAVRQLAATPPDRLRAMSLAAWNFARANHTRESFAVAYRAFAESVTRQL